MQFRAIKTFWQSVHLFSPLTHSLDRIFVEKVEKLKLNLIYVLIHSFFFIFSVLIMYKNYNKKLFKNPFIEITRKTFYIKITICKKEVH